MRHLGLALENGSFSFKPNRNIYPYLLQFSKHPILRYMCMSLFLHLISCSGKKVLSQHVLLKIICSYRRFQIPQLTNSFCNRSRPQLKIIYSILFLKILDAMYVASYIKLRTDQTNLHILSENQLNAFQFISDGFLPLPAAMNAQRISKLLSHRMQVF